MIEMLHYTKDKIIYIPAIDNRECIRIPIEMPKLAQIDIFFPYSMLWREIKKKSGPGLATAKRCISATVKKSSIKK